MNKKKVIVTGAAGFIASNLARQLSIRINADIILVDSFVSPMKSSNIEGIKNAEKVERENLESWFVKNYTNIDFVFHLGARTDTTEFDMSVFEKLNVEYSKMIWKLCTHYQIPMLYASSAATYGLGENSFSDDHAFIKDLQPLNPYGLSKQLFDLFVLEQKEQPPFWAGLKFFNVYGPYEAHKGRMASVAYHAYNQVKTTGKIKLFQSHNINVEDGEQLRDFIYVDDIVDICLYFYHTRKNPGIYNAGTGKAGTFNEMARAIFASLNAPESIEYIPIPEDIRDKYQYFTEAKMGKLRAAGYTQPFIPLTEGIARYMEFLKQQK